MVRRDDLVEIDDHADPGLDEDDPGRSESHSPQAQSRSRLTQCRSSVGLAWWRYPSRRRGVSGSIARQSVRGRGTVDFRLAVALAAGTQTSAPTKLAPKLSQTTPGRPPRFSYVRKASRKTPLADGFRRSRRHHRAPARGSIRLSIAGFHCGRPRRKPLDFRDVRWVARPARSTGRWHVRPSCQRPAARFERWRRA
jgi:hypothetical protein